MFAHFFKDQYPADIKHWLTESCEVENKDPKAFFLYQIIYFLSDTIKNNSIPMPYAFKI